MSLPFTDNEQSIDEFTFPPGNKIISQLPIGESKNTLDWFFERYVMIKFDNMVDNVPSPQLNALLQRVVSGSESMIRKKNTDEFLKDIDKITSEE
jgi:arsenate reductase-like glutaredoxin family protein